MELGNNYIEPCKAARWPVFALYLRAKRQSIGYPSNFIRTCHRATGREFVAPLCVSHLLAYSLISWCAIEGLIGYKSHEKNNPSTVYRFDKRFHTFCVSQQSKPFLFTRPITMREHCCPFGIFAATYVVLRPGRRSCATCLTVRRKPFSWLFCLQTSDLFAYRDDGLNSTSLQFSSFSCHSITFPIAFFITADVCHNSRYTTSVSISCRAR